MPHVLRKLAFGNIDDAAYHTQRPSVRIANHESPVLDHTVTSVLGAEAIIDGKLLSLRMELQIDFLQDSLPVLRMDTFDPPFICGLQFRKGIAEHPGNSLPPD